MISYYEMKALSLFVTQKDNKFSSGMEVSKLLNSTYSHTTKVLINLKKYKLIDIEKDGRRKLLTLTKQGQELSLICNQFFILESKLTPIKKVTQRKIKKVETKKVEDDK